MTQAQRMRRALDKIVIPKLREAGFEGIYPHFRRKRGDRIDLIAFTALKYGNGFEVAGSVIFPREKPDRQNILRPQFSKDDLKLHPEWKAWSERGIDEMNLFDTSRRNVLPGMGWKGCAFYYSDVYRQFDPTLCSFVYMEVGEKQAETVVPKAGMKLVQKATPELTERIAEMVSKQLDDLPAWFDQIQCWNELEQWAEKKYGKNHWYDKFKKAFRTIVENW